MCPSAQELFSLKTGRIPLLFSMSLVQFSGVPHITDIPILDLRKQYRSKRARMDLSQALYNACRSNGFFYVSHHGIPEKLCSQLETLSSQFFTELYDAKMRIAMSKGGRAWRGYFPVGGELTSGLADQKEGIYFGAELEISHPLVKAGTPMHGPNLFPAEVPALKPVVLEYMDAMTQLGHRLMECISLSLNLEENYFRQHYTEDPLILFRIFNYPPQEPTGEYWGVGEHTDYGVLTLLRQDKNPGLEIKSHGQWIQAPPIPETFVCNIGDMLERMTQGLYRSTPHRVRNTQRVSRLSFPFFFDPNFFAKVEPLPMKHKHLGIDDKEKRWDKASVHEFKGTYGEYLLSKVSKVFPGLKAGVLP